MSGTYPQDIHAALSRKQSVQFPLLDDKLAGRTEDTL